MINRYEDQLLRNTFIKRVIIPGIDISDKALEEYYMKNRNNFTKPAQYKIQKITAKTMDEARDIESNLQKGADFSWYLKKKSQDDEFLMSKDEWITKEKMPQPLRDIIDTLKIGDISPVIQNDDSQYAIYHLQGKIEEQFEEFNNVKDAVYRSYFSEQVNNTLDKYIAQLKTEAKIKIYDEAIQDLQDKLEK